jgi:conjugative transfer signal peptidase TraF
MKPRRIAFAAWTLAAVIAAGTTWANAAGFQINATASAPKGIWRVSALDPQAIQRGTIVSICPPDLRIVEIMRDRGFLELGDCPRTETVALLKPVAAVAGDTVSVTAAGIAVNGRSLPRSIPERGMPAYPTGTYRVPSGNVWLISSYSAGSFDSRYFGPVPLTKLRGRAIPILVHGDPAGMSPSLRALSEMSHFAAPSNVRFRRTMRMNATMRVEVSA